MLAYLLLIIAGLRFFYDIDYIKNKLECEMKNLTKHYLLHSVFSLPNKEKKIKIFVDFLVFLIIKIHYKHKKRAPKCSLKIR